MSSAPLLADLTTIGLGGPAGELVTVTTAGELAQALQDHAGDEVLVLGGGSNLVVADAGFPGTVIRIAIPGVAVGQAGADGGVDVTIGAGENWEAAVRQVVARGLTGFAPLSGIPGSTGATPVQNVGAYGTEVSDLLTSVTLYDRSAGVLRTATAAELGLGYRSSALRGTSRAVVTDVTFRLGRTPTTVSYRELASTLGIAPGGTAPEADIRAAVLDLRRGKGMVIEHGNPDPDTRSAGSFFTNPILDGAALQVTDAAIHDRFGPDAAYPRYPAGQGQTKLSAAWLIERAGFVRGFAGPGGRVGLSTKHTLALVNRGGTTSELLALARQVRDGVRAAFAVDLRPEPVLVGVSLDD